MNGVNPLAALFLIGMSLIVLVGDRRKAVGAVLAIAAFIPLGQNVVIAGLHFYFLRILILVGLGRLLLRREASSFEWALVDKLFVAWVAVGVVCEVVRGASAETFGTAFDALGTYFIIRLLVKDKEDVLTCLRMLAYSGIIIGICMVWESMAHHDPFYILGGVSKTPMVREGRLRCEGPFRQPILAGTFGATLFPLMVGLWQQSHKDRRLALGGLMGSMMITVTSQSSGPALTFLAAVVGFCLWPFRNQMRLFRRGAVAVLLGLSVIMSAPVWFIIGRISDLTGGGGYYRSYLIDECISHFSQWWLVGTSYTANWAGAGIGTVLPNNPNMVDITNHYIAQAIHGGILELILFLAIIVVCFKNVGRAVRGRGELSVSRFCLWAFGVSLAGHCTAFISVSYFDQIQVFWFWILAMISGIPVWAARKVQATTAAIPENITVEAPALV